MKFKKALIILIFIVGLGIFTYPIINKKVSDYQIEKTISVFNSSIKDLDPVLSNKGFETSRKAELEKKYDIKGISNLYEDMRKYNKDIYLNKQVGLVDPFSYEKNSFDLTQLGLENNVIGYISIPKINIEIPIYLGATQENMKKGGANLGETSVPIGGINTNAVISAHRGMKTHPMFRDIEELSIGDEVKVTNMWDELTYKVVETKIINPDEISEVFIQEGRDLITLITCHPYTKNYQRYVVFCERENEVIDDEAMDNEKINEVNKDNIKNKKVYSIIDIEKFFRYVGIVLIIIIIGYTSYKLIIRKKS